MRGSMMYIRQQLLLILGLVLVYFGITKLELANYSPRTYIHFQDSTRYRQLQDNNISRSRNSIFLHAKSNLGKRHRNPYLVNTPYCKIPNFHPFHPSIKRFVRTLKPVKCEWNVSLVYQIGYTLIVNWTAAVLPPYNSNVRYCTYKPIYRPNILPTHKDFYRYGRESDPFYMSIKVPDELVRVKCYDKQYNRIYLNFHAFIQHNADLYDMFKRRLETHMKEKYLKKYLNVMLVGIDSLSRLNFLRQMVKTRAFLKDKLAAFDMMGYNKVGDNTFVNIVPLTLGKFVEETPWDSDKSFDEFKFIWKQYADRGYRTLYAEDRPDISIFDYLKKGFNTPPCEHYYRPMSIAMYRKSGYWTRNHTCFQDRLEAGIVLNYTYDFVNTYKNDAHFSFTFLTGLTHGYPNGASAIDDIYYNFFKRLHNNDLIRNTVIFFFSDHGMRYGPIRETFIGKLEERLPLMYLMIPRWLRNSYPDLLNVLHINQNRLATPFDVYETLKDILFFDGLSKQVNNSSRGVSWFSKIPETRTCKSAGIMPHWCTCLQHQRLKTNAIEAVNAGNEVLKEINKLVLQYESICEELSIYRIRDVTRIYESDPIILGLRDIVGNNTERHVLENKRNESTEYVQVTIETVPGRALFEATVRVELHKEHMYYRLVDEISRISLYGNQSACIDDYRLKKFCFCK